MCLAIPGRILAITGDPARPTTLKGKVDFAGITKDIALSFVPEVEVGQYVLVHVGFAISIVDEEEARRVFAYLDEMDELRELQDGDGSPSPDGMQKGTDGVEDGPGGGQKGTEGTQGAGPAPGRVIL